MMVVAEGRVQVEDSEVDLGAHRVWVGYGMEGLDSC
jgi:hypothetical protein